VLGLYSLTGLFMLLFAIALASYRTLRMGSLHGSGAGLASVYMDSTPLGYTTMDQAGLHAASAAARRGSTGLSSWVNRIFIAIVLQCAAIYLISSYPGTRSPFWLGVILQGFTYGSAAVYYASWGKEPHDDGGAAGEPGFRLEDGLLGVDLDAVGVDDVGAGLEVDAGPPHLLHLHGPHQAGAGLEGLENEDAV